MAPQKRHSGQSFCGSSSSSVERSSPPLSPTTKRGLSERFRLPDGTIAHRVPVPCHSRRPMILFSDKGNPGVSIKNILNVLQWPGYDILHAGHITVKPDTKQELAVALCTAFYKFYSCASKILPSVESVPWALSSKVHLGDIMLTCIRLDTGVWVPEFYVLRK